MNRYYETLGFYEPSVFHLYVKGKGELKNLDSWDDEQKSTFIHEYVHFLQDIFTIQGLNNMYINGEYLRYVTQQYKSNPSHEIKRAVDPFSAGSNVDQNWLVKAYMFGTMDYSIAKFIDYDKVHAIDLVDYQTGKTTNVEKIELTCIRYDAKVVKVDFGSIQIMEGMAKYIQNCLYPPITHTSPYNPYYIALDVADKIMSGISVKPLNMIALFDYALQSSNPGMAFVRYLEEKVAIGYTADTLTSDVIYSDLKNASTMHSVLGLCSLKDAYDKLSKSAEGVVSEMLGGMWYYKNINLWYQSLIQRARKARFDSPELFTMLVRGGKLENNDLFKRFLSTFGTPVVTNSNHTYDFVKPVNVPITKIELMNVYAMMQLPRVFMTSGAYTCPLRKYCQNQKCGLTKQFVDKRCVKAPWTRMRSWNRCLFNHWLYFKGFKDIKFVN